MKTTSQLWMAVLAVSVVFACGQLLACDDCAEPHYAVQQKAEEYRSSMFDRSYFTHAPRSGQRVVQYAPEQPAYRTEGHYERSAMRYTQSTIGTGRNADRMNIVETWGRGAEIRPYGEWERPYRKGAQPIWMTDPQAYYYSNNQVFLSDNRDRVTFDRADRGKKHGGKYDKHGKKSGKHSGGGYGKKEGGHGGY